MSNLFVIGNGFDISHKLKTSYENFHTYLKKEYPNAKNRDCIPQYVVGSHGDTVPLNENEVVGFIKHVLCDVDGDKWSDLESSIGKIDFENYLNDFEDDEEDDLFDLMYSNESCAIDLVDTLLRIPFYFNQWILTIELNKRTAKNDFLRLINKESDLFLSFNYTKTLEILYGVKNVCHIHGIQGKELLFGHGHEYNYYSDEIYGKYPGTEESFQKAHDNLKKDTQAAIDSHKDFFEMLKPAVNNIYSYGFSFSEVDEIYIRKICNTLDTKEITWYLNDFDNEITRDVYKDIIVRCGFEGSFNTYSIIK